MRAGARKHKITVQNTTQTQDTYGGVTDSWGTYCTRFAGVKTFTGRESVEGQQIIGSRIIRFTLPYDSVTDAITTKMRISWDSRTFDIQDVENVDERNREVFLTCLERNV